MLKLGLLGALTALLVPTFAAAQDAAPAPPPLPPADLPSDDWDRGVACDALVLSVMLVMAQEDEKDLDEETGQLFDRLSATFEWWSTKLSEMPGYTDERYKTDTSAYIRMLIETEHPDADQWTANLDACVSEAEAGGAGDERD
ncbi:MAG TPA: hypothetical protein VF122_02295 [Caulobacteraceae bacterium]